MAERHDFNFTDWNFEIKGTTGAGISHTINGIDQLKSLTNKKLAFISFLISKGATNNSESLPDIIDDIKHALLNRPDLIIMFNDLLAQAGYNPIHSEDYRKLKIQILESTLFEVDDSFPTLTTDKLRQPLDRRISSIRYDISLEGLTGKKFAEINLGEYFY
jgi:hypothetical protein